MWGRWTVGPFLALAVLFFLILRSCNDDGDWPVESVGSDHPIANSMGEMISGLFYDAQQQPPVHRWMHYQHPGLDILARPSGEENAPFVVVTTSGTVGHSTLPCQAREGTPFQCGQEEAEASSMNPIDVNNMVRITAPDGVVYQYLHLDYSSVTATTKLAILQKQDLNKGDRIGQVFNAFPCGADHLHYDMSNTRTDGTRYWLNPLSSIEPRPDLIGPTINHVYLAGHNSNPWHVFPTTPQCTTVKGAVDIIVEFSDRDDAGSTNVAAGRVGLHKLEWKACKKGIANCVDWQSDNTYDTMDVKWSTAPVSDVGSRFSFKSNMISIPEPWTAEPMGSCQQYADTKTFMIAAPKNGGPSWNTTDTKYGTGDYDFTVRVSDRIGKSDELPISVCVRNP